MLAKMMRLISIVLNILSTPLFLLYCSFVGALLGFWDAVCRHGPCGLISSLHPWDNGIPPDIHGF